MKIKIVKVYEINILTVAIKQARVEMKCLKCEV